MSKVFKMRNFFLSTLFLLGFISAFSQMQDNGKVYYGNEWIDYTKDYLKIQIQSKGIYKVEYQEILDAGLQAGFSGSELQLFNNGEELAIFTSSEGIWTSSDYLLFYGEKNDGAIDRFHYDNWEEEQLNPKYSMYSDIRCYYLLVNPGSSQNRRYTFIENDLSNNTLAAEEYYMHRQEQVYSDFSWSPSAPDVPDAHYSSFIKTEGFGRKLSAQHSLNFNIDKISSSSAEPAYFEMRTGSNTQTEHIIHIDFNGQLIETDEYSGNQVIDYRLEVPKELLQSNNQVFVEGKGFADLITIAHSALVYPREFDALNQTYFEFHVEAGKPDAYYEVRRFNPGGKNYLFDLENERYLLPQLQSGVAKFRISNSGMNSTKLALVAANIGLKDVASLERIQFESLDDLNPEYLIITSNKLNNNDDGRNPVQEYADFRASNLGGGYKTAIVNVEDLFDQYAYGIDNHSLAIRNFAQAIKPNWPDFKMVFIIGKALSYGNKNKNTNIVSYVPTYGKPGSDNLMFSDRGLTYAFVGVGRVAARNKDDVANYLDKVSLHAELRDVRNSSIEDRMWLKDVIHLSGGDPGIQQQLFNHLGNMKEIIENGKFGGNVNTYRKTSSDPVQTALSQQILNNINNGISILSFFGHSSAGTFDFSVEDPSEYSNTGKLPLILSMGCRSGDIHETVYSLSEDMILTKDLGAIAFVASSGSAFPTPLSVLGKDFYAKISNEFYGKPVGLALRQVSEDLFEPESTKIRTLHEQNTLHGDPALILYTSEGPDYVVDFSSIHTNGDVGAADDNIMISFDIVNLGQGIKDSIDNLLIHEYGDQLKDSIYFRTLAPSNRESVDLEIPNPGFAALGKNSIDIILDVNNRVSEAPLPVAEENNSIKKAYTDEGFCFFVFDNSAFPVYPPEFAIVNKNSINLIASSTNALAEKTYYQIEFDTTELFNSPMLRQGEVLSSPARISWNPGVELKHNTVYYWRISPKVQDDAIWNGSSFIYLEDSSEGWNQSHLYQWQKDKYNNYEFDGDRRKFLYAENLNDIQLSNGAYPLHEIQMNVQNEPSGYLPFLSDGEMASGIYVATFDAVTGLPWLNQPGPDGGLYDSELYTWWALNFPNFPYKTDTPENRAKAIHFIDNVIPDGNYVVLYTIQRRDYPGIGNYRPDEWAGDASVHPQGKDLMTLLENYGAERVRELESGPRPYIFVFKKNDPSFNTREIIADNDSQVIELDLEILGSWHEGSVKSTPIGPAVEWNKLLWNLENLQAGEDSIKLDLLGINRSGQEELIYENITEYEFDISGIDSERYPYLRLRLFTADEISRTSAQMKYWRILYKETPEALLDIPQKYVFQSDTLYLGESLRFCSVASNLTQTDMDSLLVEYTIVDENNKEYVINVREAELLAGSSVELNFEYPTDNLLGINQFRVEINPGKDQPEKYDFNNIGVQKFTVLGDRINPILDLTFDGMRIMDGDIVSPTPHIRIELKDENKFLRLDDVNDFDLALQKLPDNQAHPIDLNQDNIVFTPADTSGQNIAILEYFPELEEGEYILYVQAKDASGNLSGDQDIEARFRVIADTRISNVLNYPNPFSTSTQFIFTITGYELPEVFTIQIMTLSGKIVREITKEELGGLRIGLNRTSYRWDGRDEYGSKLANGVYLFRVLSSFNDNKPTQLYNEDIDGFFTRGFGKMVIMR